jgi:hypothetical protein
MKQNFINNRMAGAERPATVRPDAEPMLNVALVYADGPTRERAEQVLDQIADGSADRGIHRTDCTIGNLREMKVFSQSVADLARADVIVVSLHEVDRLPAAFYLWVNLWLQVRAGRPGTLLALLAPSQEPTLGTQETRRYLYAAARQGGLDLVECGEPGQPIRGLRDTGAQWAKAA